ncbi:MAG: hypothetical protein ACREFO_02260 [Acetobacteraceae bacterium]
MTRRQQALITAASPAGPNTRRMKRAGGALCKDAASKDVVSRTPSLLAARQVIMWKVAGWDSLEQPPSALPLNLVASHQHYPGTGNRATTISTSSATAPSKHSSALDCLEGAT